MSMIATTRDERPVFIRAKAADLFAVLTLPTVAANEKAVVLAWGGGAYPSSGRNQIRARLARRLAASGYHVLRLDYMGMAESSGRTETVDVRRPWSGNIVAACEWLLSEQLARSIILVGYCFGARCVLSSTTHVRNLDRVVLIGPPVADGDHVAAKSSRQSVFLQGRRALKLNTLRNLANPRKRLRYARLIQGKVSALPVLNWLRPRESRRAGAVASDRFLDPLQQLVQNGIPLLFVYGTADDFWPDFQLERHGPFAQLFEHCELKVIDAAVNLQTDQKLQQQLIETVEEWLCTSAPGG